MTKTKKYQPVVVEIPNWTELISWLKPALGAIGLKEVPAEKTITDDTLTLPNDVLIIWNRDTNKWEVTSVSIIRGVRYTRNGDGWPDEEEYTLLKDFSSKNFYQTVLFAAEAIAKRSIADALDNDAMDRIMQEAEAGVERTNR